MSQFSENGDITDRPSNLVRLLDEMPRESAINKFRFSIFFGAIVGLAGVTSLIIMFTKLTSSGRSVFIVGLFGVVVLGGLLVLLGVGQIEKTKVRKEMLMRFAEDISAHELAIAISSSARKGAGYELAHRLWRDEKRTEFASVWLLKFFGEIDLVSAHIVLLKLGKHERIAELLMKREARITWNSVWIFLAAFYLPKFGELVLQKAIPEWQIDEKLKILSTAFSLIFFATVSVIGYLVIHRRGDEWHEIFGHLSRLSEKELKTFVGMGVLSQIAEAILKSRGNNIET